MAKIDDEQELDGKYLGTISSDFLKVSETLKEAAYQLKVRNISDYAIFPISKVDLPFGQKLIGREDLGTDWNYYFSFMEEFVQLGFIDEEAINAFHASYKNPDEFCCLFVVDKEFTNFLYIPYPED